MQYSTELNVSVGAQRLATTRYSNNTCIYTYTRARDPNVHKRTYHAENKHTYIHRHRYTRIRADMQHSFIELENQRTKAFSAIASRETAE